MEIIKNKDLIWETDKYDVILVGTSIYNKLDNGFQSKLKVKYPIIEKANDKTPYGDSRKYGKRLTIDDNTPIISLLYICGYPHCKRDTLNYEALEHALHTASAEFKGKKVATTVIGSSIFDGNGDKDKILEIIENSTKGLDLTVYDYEQLRKNDERKIYLSKINIYRDTDYEKYKELKSQFGDLLKKLYIDLKK